MFWGIFNLGCLHWTGVDMNKALKLIFLEAKQSAMLTHTAEGFPVVCMEPQLWKRLREAMEDAMAPQPAQEVVDCHATGVCVQSGLRAEQPTQQEPSKPPN
jgi:hypothetical protein